jgi:hypothetical protein
MNVRYRIELSQTERAELTALLSAGKHAARKLKRAQILLAADAGVSDEAITVSVGVGIAAEACRELRFKAPTSCNCLIEPFVGFPALLMISASRNA